MTTPTPLTTPTAAPIGLLAGWGRFPIVFAEKARLLGLSVVCVGIHDEASPELIPLVDQFHWAGIARFGRVVRCFKRAGVRQIVMAGKIHKVRLNTPMRIWRLLPDWRTLQFWLRRRRDTRDDALLLGIVGEFERDGMTIASALDFCPELLVKEGVLTRRGVTPRETNDIAYGWDVARELGRFDIGQSVAVFEKAVLAVEAIEGTDQAIRRAGQLCPRGGFVVVKVAKPHQDMRFDVPTVGTATIETMRQAGARVLAIEADKTIILDQEKTVALAEKFGITIVACRSGPFMLRSS
ncbi:MAG: UDP-2,3-diacylglucosamine diphosphatase LpxI [Gemmataceae bacterium]|nr:UDP-2,3-diacylglucosamine diphosphatase LpxI [Gemmataceae bacterium]